MKDQFRVDIVMENCRYKCLVDSRFLIIEVKPYILELSFKNLRKIFNKYKTKAEFHFIGYVEPIPFLPEDVFELFLYMNPNIKILAEEFDCDL